MSDPRLAFGGRPLLGGGCVAAGPCGEAAVLTSRGAALLSLDLDPGGDTGGFGFARVCLATLEEADGSLCPPLPLGVDDAAVASGLRLADPLADPLRAFHVLARRLPLGASRRGGGRDGFVKADWSPFARYGRGRLAVVSESGRLVVLGFGRSLLEAESARVAADLGRLWCRAYVHLGRVVRPELSGELPLAGGHPLLPGTPPETESDEDAMIWCDNMAEFALASLDMCFAGVSWSRQVRPKPWYSLMAGVTRSGVLVLFSFNPTTSAAALLHATYACAIGGGGVSEAPKQPPGPRELGDFSRQACMLRLCDLPDGVSLLALVGTADGRVLGLRIRLASADTADDAGSVTVTAGAEWSLWRLADHLQPLDAVWSVADRFGCVAKGAHLVSFGLANSSVGGISASTVTTSYNSLQITGLACVGSCVYYCCLDGRLFCAKFAPAGDAAAAGAGAVVCSGVSELFVAAEPGAARLAALGPRGRPQYHGIYCSRNAVLLGVLEGRVWRRQSGELGGLRKERSRLTFRLMCATGEDQLVELLRNANRPLSEKLDVLEAVRHVYYRDRLTKDNFLRAELDSLAGIVRSPATMLALARGPPHDLRVLRFLLSLAGGPQAAEMARAAECLMLLRQCGQCLNQLLCRLAAAASAGDPRHQHHLLLPQQPQQPRWRPSERDLRVLACMLDTLRRACDADPRLLGAARRTWRLDSVMERAEQALRAHLQLRQQQRQHLEISRTCYVCQTEDPAPGQHPHQLLLSVVCANGHAFARCARTLLPVAVSAGFLRCSVCAACCLGPEGCDPDDAGCGGGGDWLATGLLAQHDLCLFCDAPMIPVRMLAR